MEKERDINEKKKERDINVEEKKEGAKLLIKLELSAISQDHVYPYRI